MAVVAWVVGLAWVGAWAFARIAWACVVHVWDTTAWASTRACFSAVATTTCCTGLISEVSRPGMSFRVCDTKRSVVAHCVWCVREPCACLCACSIGRRLRHYWGPRLGYYPVPWYETPEFTQQVQTAGVPQVRTRQLQVTLIPYGATNAIMPGGVGPGGIFQFSHPGSTQRYLIAGPANAAAGLSVCARVGRVARSGPTRVVVCMCTPVPCTPRCAC